MLACANTEWESKREFSAVLDYLSEIMRVQRLSFLPGLLVRRTL